MSPLDPEPGGAISIRQNAHESDRMPGHSLIGRSHELSGTLGLLGLLLFLLVQTGMAQEVPFPRALAEQQKALEEWVESTRSGRGSAEASRLLSAQANLETLKKAIELCQRDEDRIGLGLLALLQAQLSELGSPEHLAASRLAVQHLEPSRPHLSALAAYHLASESARAGQYQESARLMRQALEQAREVQLDVRLEGEIAVALALAEAWSGEPEPARLHLDQAIRLFTQASYAEGLLRAELTLIDLLSLSQSQSAALDAAQAVRPKLTGAPLRSLRLRNELKIAGFLFFEGRLREADVLAREILAESRAEPRNPQLELECLTLLASLCTGQGRYEEAEQILRQNVELIHPQKDPVRASLARYQLAQLYLNHGRLEGAQSYLAQALDLARAQQHPELQSTIQYSLATVLWDQGKLEESLPHYEQMLTQLLGSGPIKDQAHARIRNALALWARQDYQGTLREYEQLLELICQNGGATQAARLYADLSTVYRQLGDLGKETDCLARSMALRTGSQSPMDTVLLMGRLVDLHLVRGEIPQARSYLTRLQGKLSELPSPLQAQALLLEGRVLASEGHANEAERAFVRSVSLLETMQLQALYAGGETSALGLSAKLETASDQLVLLLLQQGRSEDAWQQLERSRGRIYEVVKARLANADQKTRQRLEQLYGRLTHLEALERKASAPGRVQEMAALRQSIQQFEAQVDRAHRGREATFPSLSRTLEQIPEGTAILHYVVLPGEAWLLVLTGEGIAAHKLAVGGESELSARVGAAHRLLARGPDTDAQEALVSLHEALILPVQASLTEKKRLLIVQDGSLCQIPFEALSSPDGRALIDRYAISYLESSREPAESVTLTGSESALIIGGPSYALQRATASHSGLLRSGAWRAWGPLPGAVTEAREIAERFDAVPVTGDDATEAAFKQQAESAQVIHVATHGYFTSQEPPSHPLFSGNPRATGFTLASTTERNPLASCGLAFAGANENGDGQQDGNLTGLEVLPLDLGRARLVVLSACLTARGDQLASEGIYGLRRAFRLAGARTLVLSLWKVDDQATRKLMGIFYEHLLQGDPPATAMQKARLSLREDARYRHPYFWAAFVVIGNVR